ncbi:hypothetical protein GE061_012367 [Apolygus lucorum]|uniref:DUF4371 domain-containing protein n=1 Tax=Apolygus lucorum TaxID=248454 RepID=A0A8S9XU74_APOLU|nr:hypothetical protein GE061_012367 [Apolygus lucorum]
MTSKRHFENIQNSSLQPPEHQKRVKRERSIDFWDNFIEDQKVGRRDNVSGMIIKKEKLDDREDIEELSDESLMEIIKEESTEFQNEEGEEDPLMVVEQDPLQMTVNVNESQCDKKLKKVLEMSKLEQPGAQKLKSEGTENSSIDPFYSSMQSEVHNTESELPMFHLLVPEANTLPQVQVPVKREEDNHMKMAAEGHEPQSQTELKIQTYASLAAQRDTKDSSSSWHEGTFFEKSSKIKRISREKMVMKPKPKKPKDEPRQSFIDLSERSQTKKSTIAQEKDVSILEEEDPLDLQEILPLSAAKLDNQTLDSTESSLSERELPLADPLPLCHNAGTFGLEKTLNIQSIEGKQPFSVQRHSPATTTPYKLPPRSEKNRKQTGCSELPSKEGKNSIKETISAPKTSTCLLSNILTKPERSFVEPNGLDPTNESMGLVNHVCCAINTLLIKKFTGSQWNDEQRRHIVFKDRRPVPVFKEWKKEKILYKRNHWLSGCNKLKKYVCWYCLLFSTKGVWSIGYGNKNFQKEADKHAVSLTHLENKRHFSNWKKGSQEEWKQADSSSLISRLLTTEFLLWDDKERIELLKSGKPYPTYEETRMYLRRPLGNRQEVCRPAHHFKCFETITWLTGCLEINSTFCWPCLLFSPACAKLGTPLYNESSSTKFQPLSTGAKEHEKQKLHMKAYLRLRVRERELKETITSPTPTVGYERMIKNRIFMKYLIDAICARKKQISNHVDTNAEYASIARLMYSYNESLKMFLDDFESTLAGINHEFPEIVMSSIEHILMNEIKKEVQDSKFISCIIDSTSMPNRGCQVIIRYVDGKGEIQERFVGLLKLKQDEMKNDVPATLSTKIKAILNDKLDAKQKVIGFTYDGAFLKPSDIITFNKHMRSNYPLTKFFHHRKHGWDILLQQTLAQLDYCTAFIRDLEHLSRFLTTTRGAKEWICSMDQQSPNSMNSPGAIVEVIRKHFVSIIIFLDTMVQQSESWKVKVVNQASELLEFLRPLHTRFLILLLAKINEIMVPLSKELEDEWATSNKHSISGAAVECIVKMNALSAEFEDLYQIAYDMLPPSQRCGSSYQVPKNRLRIQFDGIIEHVSMFIRNRDAEMEKGCFRVNQFLTRQTSTESVRENMTSLDWVPPELELDEANLEAQLEFLRNDQHFCGNNSLIKLMNEHGMEDVTPELLKLLKFVYTIPMKATDNGTKPANGGGIGALDRMKIYVQINSKLEFPDALMWMEKCLLTRLQEKNEFYVSVIDHLANGNHVEGILAELK